MLRAIDAGRRERKALYAGNQRRPFEVDTSMPPWPVEITCTPTRVETGGPGWSAINKGVGGLTCILQLAICWLTLAICEVRPLIWLTSSCNGLIEIATLGWRLVEAVLKSVARFPAAVRTDCRNARLVGSGESCCRLLKKLVMSAPMPVVALLKPV